MKSKAIMLNKYGLNVGAAYVEQSTLLEPNNFIPSWEAGDEEKKEVSNALRVLRENYDQIHRLVTEKEHALEQLNVSYREPEDVCLAIDLLLQRLSPPIIKINNNWRYHYVMISVDRKMLTKRSKSCRQSPKIQEEARLRRKRLSSFLTSIRKRTSSNP